MTARNMFSLPKGEEVPSPLRDRLQKFPRCWDIYLLTTLLVAMLTSQFFFTAVVYSSNQMLLGTLKQIQAVGYFLFPNAIVMASLPFLGTAFRGAIFFSLSTGLGIWGATFLLAGLTQHGGDKRGAGCSWSTWGLLLFWISLGIYLNIDGPSPLKTVSCLMISFAVFAVARLFRGCCPKPSHSGFPVFLMAVFLLFIAICGFRAKGFFFLTIRDHLLLTHSPGRYINDFYYRYALYPAEVIKSLDQKIIKTCQLDQELSPRLKSRLERLLLTADYLPLPSFDGLPDTNDTRVDLYVRQKGKNLILEDCRQNRIDVPVNVFLNQPAKTLVDFSQRSDTNGHFRYLTMLSILFGAPLALCFLASSVLKLIIGMVCPPSKTPLWASLICLSFGIVLILPLYRYGKIYTDSPRKIRQALSSSDWRERVTALKTISAQELNIQHFGGAPTSQESPMIAERYWWIRAIAARPHAARIKSLERFLKDPAVNVVCQSLYGIGRSRDPSKIPLLLNFIRTSNHWYTQLYAYQALKRLGWNQSISK